MTVISGSELVRLATETVRDLTDIVGHIEKNIASYDRIRQRLRRKRELRRLQEILREVTLLGERNIKTLWGIAEMAQMHGESKIAQNAMEFRPDDRFFVNNEIQEFPRVLLKVRDIIDEYRDDLINVDYKLYEKLHDAIDRRLDLLDIVLDKKHAGRLDIDKLRRLYIVYNELVRSLEKVKDQLQRMTRQRMTRVGKP
jgi:hypothetical protein